MRLWLVGEGIIGISMDERIARMLRQLSVCGSHYGVLKGTLLTVLRART